MARKRYVKLLFETENSCPFPSQIVHQVNVKHQTFLALAFASQIFPLRFFCEKIDGFPNEKRNVKIVK